MTQNLSFHSVIHEPAMYYMTTDGSEWHTPTSDGEGQEQIRVVSSVYYRMTPLVIADGRVFV